MTQPRYPDIRVKLIGEDGNAFTILGKVTRALREAGVSAEERQRFMFEAQSGDYDNLLRTVMNWVTVEGTDDDDEEWEDPIQFEDEE